MICVYSGASSMVMARLLFGPGVKRVDVGRVHRVALGRSVNLQEARVVLGPNNISSHTLLILPVAFHVCSTADVELCDAVQWAEILYQSA